MKFMISHCHDSKSIYLLQKRHSWIFCVTTEREDLHCRAYFAFMLEWPWSNHVLLAIPHTPILIAHACFYLFIWKDTSWFIGSSVSKGRLSMAFTHVDLWVCGRNHVSDRDKSRHFCRVLWIYMWLAILDAAVPFLWGLCQVAGLPVMFVSARGCTCSKFLGIFSLFNFSHSEGYVVLLCCGYNLYFLALLRLVIFFCCHL